MLGKLMAKNKTILGSQCPQCEDVNEKIWRPDIKAAANVTVLVCHHCEWEFAKDQSVKIPGNLVRHAAEAMYIHEGYSSLGEYVRDCIRRMNENILLHHNNGQFAEFMGVVAEDPDKFLQMMETGVEDTTDMPTRKQIKKLKEEMK